MKTNLLLYVFANDLRESGFRRKKRNHNERYEISDPLGSEDAED